ncbi:MAG TPA: pentapeptide repeat-containing protein [Terriglobia bacterium]|nr:pentapeptide repeat-containing protein [Terriglobia bacterium]
MSKAAFAPFTSFDGKTFQDADFRDAEFVDKVSFRNAQFTGKTDFRGAKFNGVGDFTGAQFLGDVDFSGALFTEPLRFDNIRFAGKTNFSGVDFNHDAHFSSTEFAGDSDFSNATFHAWALFNKSRFLGTMTFHGACFKGSANFREVDFATDADFRKARFIAYADFPDAVFQGKANFSGASVECKTIFRNAKFTKEADFSDCRFTHPVNFSAAVFSAAAIFDRVIFLQFVDFKETRLKDSFVLSPPQGSAGLAPEIRFEGVTLEQPEKIRFSNISFERITLMGTNLRGILFENPKWPLKGFFNSTKRAVVFDEIQKDKPDPEKLAQLYKDIRANLKKAGTTQDLGDLFYSEMEVRRKQKRGDNDKMYFLRRYFSPYTLLWLVCGYGQRPLRIIAAITLAGAVFWSVRP